MSVDSVRAFLAKVRGDEALKARFQESYQRQDLIAIGSLAKELGFDITMADYQAAVNQDLDNLKSSGRITESDLAAVAGGAGSSSVMTLGGVCGATMGDTCNQNTLGVTCGPSIGTPMCSQVTCC